MHRSPSILVSLSLVAISLSALGGCAHQSAAPTAHLEPVHHRSELFCMHNVADLEVREVDMGDGAELRFTTWDDQDRGELRALIERFVELDGEARTESPDAPAFADGAAFIHHAQLHVVETEHGATLLVETSRDHVAEVRAEITEDARELATAHCPLALQLEL